MKPGRNDPCSCGSGKKYKKCCQGKFEARLKSQPLRQETECVAKSKEPTSVEMNQLAALFNVGRYTEMEGHARRLVEQYPGSGFAWKAFGTSLLMQGKEALHALQKAVELLPGDAEVHYNLGNALRSIGQLENAVASYRCVLEIKPGYVDAHINLGNALKNLGQLDKAVVSYRQALTIKPDFAEAYINLGNTLKDLGQLDNAVTNYRCALAIKPDFIEAYGKLGNALQDLGYPDGAVMSYRRALEIKPDCADMHISLGNALQDLGQLDDAVASFRRALEIKPDFADAYVNLGNALKDLRQLKSAVVSYRRALEIKPDLADAHNNLGSALRDLGQIEDAVASYRRALAIKPDDIYAYSNLLFLYGYHGLLNPDEYLAQACGWEQSCVLAQDRKAAHHRVLLRPPLAGRRLKIGYVSGDYCQHAASYFIEQLFTYHDRTRIELFAYYTRSQWDEVTERLQALVEHWVPLAGIPDAAVRDRIEADGIDVLIDLSGHTNHNRLGVFARRAAPVQAHYLGYFASTGLTEMDYWIGDEILTPAETGSHFSERVWRLPRVWVSYEGKADAPLPNWQSSRDGSVCLGSFNNLGKLTLATLALWAKVLHALPESRLLLKTKGLADAGNRQRILDALSDQGILPDRIELQDGSATPDWPAHMAYYDRLDIALDPVGGIGGGTTTCDALWMGAPVITLEGDRMASRMTASMLNAIGHPEWISRSEAEYIDKVVALARDVGQRKALRFEQRDRMANSPLCDAKDLAISLENAYRGMFEQWLSKKINRVCATT